MKDKQHNENEGYTPMPEEGEDKEPSIATKKTSKADKKAEKVSGGSATREKQYEHDEDEDEDAEANVSVGAIVGATVIVLTLVVGGTYLFFQSDYYRSPKLLENLPPVPAPPPDFEENDSEGNTGTSSSEVSENATGTATSSAE